jgi:hypothetical protein
MKDQNQNERSGVKLEWWTAAVDGMIGPLRRGYRLEVERIANGLALQFQARVFDGTKPEEDWPVEPGNEFASYPFNLLEDFCEKLSICRDRASACLVLALSKYAPKAAFAPDRVLHVPSDGQAIVAATRRLVSQPRRSRLRSAPRVGTLAP